MGKTNLVCPAAKVESRWHVLISLMVSQENVPKTIQRDWFKDFQSEHTIKMKRSRSLLSSKPYLSVVSRVSHDFRIRLMECLLQVT